LAQIITTTSSIISIKFLLNIIRVRVWGRITELVFSRAVMRRTIMRVRARVWGRFLKPAFSRKQKSLTTNGQANCKASVELLLFRLQLPLFALFRFLEVLDLLRCKTTISSIVEDVDLLFHICSSCDSSKNDPPVASYSAIP
jgi:hypothetical protein